MELKVDKQAYYEDIYRAVKNKDRELFRSLFLKLHGIDQAEVFNELYPENKAKTTELLSAEEFAEIFDVMEFFEQEETYQVMPDSYMKEVFTYVSDDNLVNFLKNLEEDRAREIISKMNLEDRRLIESLMKHTEDTAGAIMTTELVKVSIHDKPNKVIETMRSVGRQAELIYYIYVVDDKDRLYGVLSLRDLILAPPAEEISSIMNSQVVSVNINTDQEEVASLIQEYDLLAIPVVDDNNVLKGLVTVDDVMDVIEQEATEDFYKMGGISGELEDGQEGSETTILGMTKSRLPWIIMLLFMGLISANLINAFEDTLSKVVQLAVFMPILTDTAGNVGTQALAVSVRRLTIDDDGEGFWSLFFKELGAGIIMGMVSSAVIATIAFVLFRNIHLSIVVAVSLLCTVSISTIVGYTVPVLFNKINIDPAVASGPFITTINDMIALFSYFSIATMLLEKIFTGI
ncbi:MAG: magnesium transporter [Bacillota bacterium]|nr:magnesium transporter [Bacillota bacterium]